MSAAASATRQPLRHDLVRLHSPAWTETLGAHADLAALPLLADWAEGGRPFVARRRNANDLDGTIAIGLPLPPSLGKCRLGFAVPPSAVAAFAPPPRLAELRVPPAWRRAVEALVALGERCGCEPRAYGSFALAHETGLDYIAATSDLDMLWPLTAKTPEVLAALAAIEAPGRLDGEIVDGQGRGAQWQELRSALADGGGVLVKSLNGLDLLPAAAFLRGEAA